jgi:hypothetical protein
MPAAIIGGAIAAGGAVAASKIGSNATKKASEVSAGAADRASEVQQNIYNQNSATLSPYVQAGVPATAQINALLGLAPSPAQQTVQQFAPQQQAYQPNAMRAMQGLPGWMGSGRADGFDYLSGDAYNGDFFGAPQYQPQGMPQGQTVNSAPTQPSAQSAFDQYRNSTGYQFRFNEGMGALNSGWAGNGLLKSGAAAKAAMNYGQGIASAEFGNYLNALGNQQGMGLSAASAQAGVGTNYANSLGNIAMQNGNNQANAALAQGQNSAGLVNSLGTIGAGLFGASSTPRQPAYTPVTTTAYAGMRG